MGKQDREALEARIEAGLRVERERKKKAMKHKIKEKKDGFFKDFKKFITKGNVLDLAVAVVIGGAFNAIVNGLVSFIINPVISLFTGGISLDEWKTPLGEPLVDKVTGAKVLDELGNETYAAYIKWGSWIQTIINFFIIALSIFVAVRIITSVNKKFHARELEAKAAEEAKKKEEAAAAAAAAAAVEAEKEAALQQFYANVARSTELLEQLAQKK